MIKLCQLLGQDNHIRPTNIVDNFKDRSQIRDRSKDYVYIMTNILYYIGHDDYNGEALMKIIFTFPYVHEESNGEVLSYHFNIGLYNYYLF